jgi:hypothetical protein
MAYDPDEHGRLESLYLKYGSWLQSQVRSDQRFGPPSFSGHDTSASYDDALTTAHALYAYLLSNPPDTASVPRAVQWAGLGFPEDQEEQTEALPSSVSGRGA